MWPHGARFEIRQHLVEGFGWHRLAVPALGNAFQQPKPGDGRGRGGRSIARQLTLPDLKRPGGQLGRGGFGQDFIGVTSACAFPPRMSLIHSPRAGLSHVFNRLNAHHRVIGVRIPKRKSAQQQSALTQLLSLPLGP